MMRIGLLWLIFSPVVLSFYRSTQKAWNIARTMQLSVATEDLTIPARTFIQSVDQASEATKKALRDGNTLIEVDFPPLPLEYLEDSSSSARDISRANTRWAIELGRRISPEFGRISVIFPDQAELDDAIEYVDMPGGKYPHENITLATIRADSIKNANSLDQIITSIFGATIGGTVVGVPDTNVYIALVSSAQELTDLEKLHLLDPSIPLVFFNLKLDFLKGDFGLPLFPGRDLQYRFLSKVKPAYLMRSRSFATSLSKPPFIINYSGLIFRSYPEPYQSILNIGDGKTKVVGVNAQRPTAAKFRDDLTSALRIKGIAPGELKTKGTEVWWEKDDGKEVSNNWKT